MSSSLSFPAAGRGPYSIVGLDYLLTSHLVVAVNGTPVTASVNEERRSVTLAAEPAAGSTVTITRVTPRKREERLTQFLNLPSGSAGLTADLLDQDYRQEMLLAVEAADHVSAASMPADAMTLEVGGQWDGRSLKVQTLTPGSEPGDAVNKDQLDTIDAAARLLPTAVLDPDDGLMVVAGEWDDKAPAGFRTALMLGGVALLTAGVAANNVPQFGNPVLADPIYATADGRNIDLTAHAIQTDIAKRALATALQLRVASSGSSGADVTVASWSQNSNNRIGFSGTPWTNRVELNNSGPEVNGNFSPGRFDLTAGTWRIRWFFKVRQTSAGGTNMSFRITNNDDTSAQVIYYDLGVHRIIRQHNGAQLYYSVFQDELVIANASAFSLAFRWSEGTSGASNDINIGLFFQKVSTSVIS